MEASSDYRIDYKSKRGINFQHFDYNFYKIKDDILFLFSDKEATIPKLDETILRNIGAVIKTFIEKNELCETIDWIHYETKADNMRIHISMNWPELKYSPNEFPEKLLDFVNDFANRAGGYWKEDKLYITLGGEKVYFVGDRFRLASTILNEFISMAIAEKRIYILPGHSTDD